MEGLCGGYTPAVCRASALIKLLQLLTYLLSTLRDSLVEVDSFLSELSRSVLGIVIGLVLDHLHALPAFALLVAVFADHVELTDLVLEDKEQKCKEIRPNVHTCAGASPD